MNEPKPRTSARLAYLIAVPALTLALSSCGVDDGVHQAALKDLQRQKQLAAEKDDQLRTRDAEIAELKRRLGSLDAERSGTSSELASAKRTMEDLKRAQAQAEARAAQFRKLVEQFRKMTESGKLKVEIRDNRMIVSLGDRILFDPGKKDLKKEGAETLQQVTEILKEVKERDFQVAGHTDNAPIRSPKFRSNWDLSTARAVEVVNFMVKSGMEANRLSAAGYADQAPIESNDTPDGRMKNRRIEITLMPNLDDLPPITADDTKVAPSSAPASAASGGAAAPATGGPPAAAAAGSAAAGPGEGPPAAK